MSNVFQLKRSSATAAPTTLAFGELAWSDNSQKLFIGDAANSPIALAGPGLGLATAAATITVTGDDVSGSGSVSSGIALVLGDTGVTAGDHAVVTVDAKGRVTAGRALQASDVPSLTAAKVSDFDSQVRTSRLDQMATPTAAVALGSQRITGLATPTADTDGATKGYVDTTINSVIGAAPAALDTLQELSAALGDDANFASTVTTSLSTKMAKSANLSDLADAAAARTNLGVAIGSDVQSWSATLDSLSAISATALSAVQNISSYGSSLMAAADAAAARTLAGLGSMAVQAANSVAITGGSIDGITLDGGSF